MILINQDFTPQKTSDVFKEVEFTYDKYTWCGAIPKRGEYQGLELTEEMILSKLEEFYEQLRPENRKNWIKNSNRKWTTSQKNGETYGVLKALYSGEWECRVCGPVPKANAQPAARLRNLKKKGYYVGSKTLHCAKCKKNQTHDILIMLDIEIGFVNNELRKPMSEKFKIRVKELFENKDASTGKKLPSKELLIDHKFPSQRWKSPESDNLDTMTEAEIRDKFQLLTNQSNMLKSRYCDTCVKTGIRGDFMGIKWYYQGDEKWTGAGKDNEEGCKGCPWHDLENWKLELLKRLL